MKGTILDFLKLATEKPELSKELVELAGRYEFEFTDEVSDEQLENVAGGAIIGNLSQVQAQWSTFLNQISSGGIPMDINAQVQGSLRDAYVEANKDLAFNADKDGS